MTMHPAQSSAAQARATLPPGHIPEPSPDDRPAAPANGGGGLHLAIAIPHLVGNGAERVVLTLAQALLARGHRVDIVLTEDGPREYPVPAAARLFVPANGNAPHPGAPWNILQGGAPLAPPLTETPSANGTQPVANLPRHLLAMLRSLGPGAWHTFAKYLASPKRLRTVQAIARYMDSMRPDCVLANLPDAKVMCLLARSLIGRPLPIVPVIHNPMEFRNRRQLKRFARLFPSANRIVAVSHGVAKSVRATLPHVAERTAAIHNPVELDAISKRADEPAPHPWLEDGGPLVILAVGRLSKQKDYPTLIRAFARVARARPCRLLILGKGPERARLEAMLRELNLTERVALPGWVENPWAAMARAAVFVSSSRYEGLGMVLIEALACGCPVVSTDCPGGPAEVLGEGRYGALAPVGDEEQLARAILRTLEEEETLFTPEQVRHRRDERRQRARAFHPEQVAEQYLNLLGEVLPARNAEPNGAL